MFSYSSSKPDDISQAEFLAQKLTEQIKRKRIELQALISNNKKKEQRNKSIHEEKIRLIKTLETIEQENMCRETQLIQDQYRIDEIQLNIQTLNDHIEYLKRDYINEEKKYEQEKYQLVTKFDQTKQLWTNKIKPQYEQSKVYQYLKEAEIKYNNLVRQKECIVHEQKTKKDNYYHKYNKYCSTDELNQLLVQLASVVVNEQQNQKMYEIDEQKLFELKSYHRQLVKIKEEKIAAWEEVFIQPRKTDLMDLILSQQIDLSSQIDITQIQQLFLPDIFNRQQSFVNSISSMEENQVRLLKSPTSNDDALHEINFDESAINREELIEIHSSVIVSETLKDKRQNEDTEQMETTVVAQSDEEQQQQQQLLTTVIDERSQYHSSSQNETGLSDGFMIVDRFSSLSHLTTVIDDDEQDIIISSKRVKTKEQEPMHFTQEFIVQKDPMRKSAFTVVSPLHDKDLIQTQKFSTTMNEKQEQSMVSSSISYNDMNMSYVFPSPEKSIKEMPAGKSVSDSSKMIKNLLSSEQSAKQRKTTTTSNEMIKTNSADFFLNRQQTTQIIKPSLPSFIYQSPVNINSALPMINETTEYVESLTTSPRYSLQRPIPSPFSQFFQMETIASPLSSSVYPNVKANEIPSSRNQQHTGLIPDKLPIASNTTINSERSVAQVHHRPLTLSSTSILPSVTSNDIQAM
ncbi:unnamed protein product, partial [Didymodactylos carnosus]